jgi:hypothetical protein
MERALALDEQRSRRNELRRARYKRERDLVEEHAPKRFRSNATIKPRQANTLLQFSVNGGSRGSRGTEGDLCETRIPRNIEVQGGG